MERYLPEGCLWNTVENTASLKSTASLQESWREGRVLEGRVTLCDSGHNLIVDLISMKGIIPKEEGAIGIQDGSTKDIALISRVNKEMCIRDRAYSNRRHDRNFQSIPAGLFQSLPEFLR